MWPSLPPSKVARLDTDSESDSASASRSRAGVHPTSRAVVTGGPIQVSISGSLRECPHLRELFQMAEYDHRPSLRATDLTETLARTEHQIGGLLALLPRCMSIIITRDTTGVHSRVDASIHYAETLWSITVKGRYSVTYPGPACPGSRGFGLGRRGGGLASAFKS